MQRWMGIASLTIPMALYVSIASAAAPSTNPTRNHSDRPEIKFDGAPLSECIEFFRNVTGANIHVQWKALEAAGIGRDAPVHVHFRSLTLRKALTLVLSSAAGDDKLAFVSEGNVLEITTRELADKKLYTRVYPVDDLLLDVPDFTDVPENDLGASSSGGRGARTQRVSTEKPLSKTERGERLLTLIRDNIRPELSRENGGPASIRLFRGSLVVTAPQSVHDAIDR